MRVFEAAGYGLQNQGLFNNVVGYAKFTVATDGVTVSNAVGGIGSSGATSDLPLCTITYLARYGSTAPNVLFQMAQGNASSLVQAMVSGVSSNSLVFRPIVGLFSATQSVPATDATTVSQTYHRPITGAEAASGTIFLFGYSATGTVTT